MSRPLTEIRNLGPAMAAAFARAGIADADGLIALGADAAYLRWLQAGNPAHFIGYYALVMGLQDRPWNDCHGAEKIALRQRFDRLKAEAGAGPRAVDAAFEAALDTLGLRRSDA